MTTTIPHEDWLEEYVKVLDQKKAKDYEEELFGKDTEEDFFAEEISEAPVFEEEFLGVHPNHLSQMRSIYGRRNYIGRNSFTGQLAEVGE